MWIWNFKNKGSSLLPRTTTPDSRGRGLSSEKGTGRQVAAVSWEGEKDPSAFNNPELFKSMAGPFRLCRDIHNRLWLLLNGTGSRQTSTSLQEPRSSPEPDLVLNIFCEGKVQFFSVGSWLCSKNPSPTKGKVPFAVLTYHQKQALLFLTLNFL